MRKRSSILKLFFYDSHIFSLAEGVDNSLNTCKINDKTLQQNLKNLEITLYDELDSRFCGEFYVGITFEVDNTFTPENSVVNLYQSQNYKVLFHDNQQNSKKYNTTFFTEQPIVYDCIKSRSSKKLNDFIIKSYNYEIDQSCLKPVVNEYRQALDSKFIDNTGLEAVVRDSVVGDRDLVDQGPSQNNDEEEDGLTDHSDIGDKFY